MLFEIRMKDKYNEGRAEGLAEGLAEGKAKGKAEGLAEGKVKGKLKATLANLQILMRKMNCSLDSAMDILDTPQEERHIYKELLSKGL